MHRPTPTTPPTSHPLVVLFSWPALYWYSMRKHAPQSGKIFLFHCHSCHRRSATPHFSFVACGTLLTRRTHTNVRATLEPLENSVEKQRGESASSGRHKRAQIKEKKNQKYDCMSVAYTFVYTSMTTSGLGSYGVAECRGGSRNLKVMFILTSLPLPLVVFIAVVVPRLSSLALLTKHQQKQQRGQQQRSN